MSAADLNPVTADDVLDARGRVKDPKRFEGMDPATFQQRRAAFEARGFAGVQDNTDVEFVLHSSGEHNSTPDEIMGEDYLDIACRPYSDYASDYEYMRLGAFLYSKPQMITTLDTMMETGKHVSEKRRKGILLYMEKQLSDYMAGFELSRVSEVTDASNLVILIVRPNDGGSMTMQVVKEENVNDAFVGAVKRWKDTPTRALPKLYAASEYQHELWGKIWLLFYEPVEGTMMHLFCENRKRSDLVNKLSVALVDLLNEMANDKIGVKGGLSPADIGFVEDGDGYRAVLINIQNIIWGSQSTREQKLKGLMKNMKELGIESTDQMTDRIRHFMSIRTYTQKNVKIKEEQVEIKEEQGDDIDLSVPPGALPVPDYDSSGDFEIIPGISGSTAMGSEDTLSDISSVGAPPSVRRQCKSGEFLHVKTNRCRKIPVCKEYQILNQETGRCRNIPCGPNEVRDYATKKCRPYKPCKPHQVRHPQTKRCRNKPGYSRSRSRSRSSSMSSTGSVVARKYKPCKSYQERNPQTKRCRNKPCPEGQIRDSDTKRCRERIGRFKRVLAEEPEFVVY